MTKSAPSSASRKATALPSLFAEPVTSTTFPTSDLACLSVFSVITTFPQPETLPQPAIPTPRSAPPPSAIIDPLDLVKQAEGDHTNGTRPIGYRRPSRRCGTHLRRHAPKDGPQRLQDRHSRRHRRRNGHTGNAGNPLQRSRQSRQDSSRELARHAWRPRLRRPAQPPAQAPPSRRHPRATS